MIGITAESDVRCGALLEAGAILSENAQPQREEEETMSAEARMQPDPVERFAAELENARWDHDFLAEYVNELGSHKREDDIFHRMAFGVPQTGGTGPSAVTILSECYAAMSAEQKPALRRLWHDKIRREAYCHDDLRARLSWRYLV